MTYCINTSNVNKDASNCVLEDTLSEISLLVTKIFVESNTYYAHIKDNVGNETISEALDIKVLYQKVEYMQSIGTQYIDFGVKVTNSSIDFILQFTNNSVTNQGIIGAKVSSSTLVDRFNIFFIDSKIRLDSRGISNYVTSDTINLNEDVIIKLNEDRSVDINDKTYSLTVANTALNINMYIDNFNQIGTAYTQGVYAKWKTVKMYTSGELVIDFIPVYRTSDTYNKNMDYDLC